MKKIVKKLSMTVLIISTLMLSGCGSSNAEKTKNSESMNNDKKTNEELGPFEKMSDEDTKLLKAEDVITKIPNRELLDKADLDYIYVYDSWIKETEDGEYIGDPGTYEQASYVDSGEYSSDPNGGIIYYTKIEYKQMVVKPVRYVRDAKTLEWTREIILDENDNSVIVQAITSQEKIDELNNDIMQENE